MDKEKSECQSDGCDSLNSGNIRDYVKEKYGQIALSAASGKHTSCSCNCNSKDAISSDLYTTAETLGLPSEALLASMGCANPIALTQLNAGEIVLDLGSGGGIDVLLSAKRVGPSGKVYGLDMTDEMLDLARRNQAKAGISNVEFLKGEIENIPLPDCAVDVIISNCVINLSTDKDKVLREAFRVLKPGGRFAVADIVLTKPVSDKIKQHLGLWAGCIAGALEVDEYKTKLNEAGFASAEVKLVKTYTVEEAEGMSPDDGSVTLTKAEIAELASSFASAFITTDKPKR